MTIEEIKADKRLRRTYGISLAEYNEKLAAQDGKCAICKRPPGKFRLAVDHDHSVARTKITSYSDFGTWMVGARPFLMPIGFGKKAEGIKSVRLELKRRSVRGILCWRCNSGLQKYSDRPERFEAAARYLRKFEEICQKYDSHMLGF